MTKRMITIKKEQWEMMMMMKKAVADQGYLMMRINDKVQITIESFFRF